MNEFGFIARYLSPLAGKGAFDLQNDAATLQVPEGHELVVTKDALVQHVHFMGEESPSDIARKALRVNLSDCAAMGAKPYGYLLALMLPDVYEPWLEAFAKGLKQDQDAFGMSLLGGDTTHTPGPLVLSVTLFGLVPTGTALQRKGARPGDSIYVSGTIGDAAMGLTVAQDPVSPLQSSIRDFFLARYRLPEPRIELGQKLRGIATSCMDISDGLMQDLGHICKASGTGAVVEWEAVPLSDAARTCELDPETVLTGGDDYELLFTLPADAPALPGTTRIGTITASEGVKALDNGKEIPLTRMGYQHF